MIFFLVFLLVVLLVGSACLSGSETSLFSLSPHTLKSYKQSDDTRLNLIAHLMAKPRDVLVTLLILNIFSNILIQNTVSGIFDNFPSWVFKVGVPLALTLVLGEIFPKSVALPNNKAIAYRVSPVISKILRWIRPIREPLTRITSWISRVLFFFLTEEKEISKNELRHVLKTSKEAKVLLPEECEIISGALDLHTHIVKEIMRPREEIFFYKIEDPIEKLLHLFIQEEVSRIPVCRGSLENVLGILSVRQFFFHKDTIEKPEQLLPILKKPFFAPETTRAWTLLNNLRAKGEELAMIVDEYGSLSGLASQEDLMEIVVGEIKDRRDQKSLYTRSSDDVIIASGKLELSEFQRVFGIRLKSKENIVTLGGWIIEQLGDIPTAGTKYATDQFLFYILAAEPNRIRRIYVRKIKPKKHQGKRR